MDVDMWLDPKFSSLGREAAESQRTCKIPADKLVSSRILLLRGMLCIGWFVMSSSFERYLRYIPYNPCAHGIVISQKQVDGCGLDPKRDGPARLGSSWIPHPEDREAQYYSCLLHAVDSCW